MSRSHILGKRGWILRQVLTDSVFTRVVPIEDRATDGVQMSEKLNQLVDLSRLRDTGSISEEEFARLKEEVMGQDGPEAEVEEANEPRGPTIRDRAIEFAREYPRVVGSAAGLFIVTAMVMIYLTGGSGAGAVETPRGQAQTLPGSPLPEDSLAISSSDIVSMWNGLEQSPAMEGGILRSPEPGPFDGFSHKFDEANLLAGAYDPKDDTVYALMTRTSLTHPDISNMYLHLCYMLHPFSEGCIDAYWEKGLNGKELGRFLEKDRTASWTFEGNEWRLEIVDGVQTLRVISPGSARVAG